MNWTHQPYPWSNFFSESFIYLFLGGIVHAAAFIVFFLPMICFRFRGIKISTILIFQVTLFIVAMFMNGIWSCLVWGKYYWSTDYVSDFSPFYPIFQSIIDAPFGDQVGALNSISLLTLNSIWVLFACATWVSVFLITRFIVMRYNSSCAQTIDKQDTAVNRQ